MRQRSLPWRFFPAMAVLSGLSAAAAAWCWTLPTPWPWRLILCGVAASLLAVLASYRIAQRIVGPLADLRQAVAHFGHGELPPPRLPADGPELADLAAVLADADRQLRARIAAVLRQNQEQQAVLASMGEGVLAVDTDENIISLNRAAARLLGMEPQAAQGRSLQEVVRNADLRRFVANALTCQQPIDGDVVLRSARDRTLQATGTALRDARGQAIGAVIVLNDVSRLRELENMRRDFAANVSHELKTPITSIKGFVETLLDGAIHQPDDALRFLNIIARQAERLDAIIEDLLSLSKIEREAETADLELVPGSIREVLVASLHDCAEQAAARNIRVTLHCADSVNAPLNAPLLRQAVNNLLENALKYSDPGREVSIAGTTENGSVVISVTDTGCGIAQEHLSRLFERFYRVDRARSRKLGGTGLGLAIVKHIVLAHRGQVNVQSTPGEGSTFFIQLPLE